ncbi:MAG TPA: siphovirus Gp157 family protein, partial [Candidatus Eisenbacteria bacterium]|nr:siphovirus Gp157 family protein [Candidatus Eisenbacteria bacterium]
GISDLPDLIKALIRSSLDDEALIGALKQRVEDMGARLSRLKDRFDRKRELPCWAMTNGEMGKIQTEDFTLSLRQGPARLEVTDQDKIPAEFFIPQPPRLDRSGLTNALKRGDVVPGSILINGEMHIAVRVR